VRSFLPAYELRAPANLAAALDLLAREPGEWKPLAGGTDVMVLFEAGKLSHRKFFNLWKLAELRGVEVTPAHVTLRALTTYTDVQQHPVLQSEFSLLCRAARETGGIATQNRGTLGGNIINASPAADSPPALLVYDAELELVSRRGASWVPYHGFHTGYKTMLIEGDELLRTVRLPRNKRTWRQYYRKVGTRKAQAISKVCLAAAALIEGGAIRDARIAFGSVAPIVLRCAKTEALLQGRRVDAALLRAARESLATEISPIDDVRSTAHYRLRVAQNLLAESLSELIANGH
jgi:CO/xanthine dehydrogenase FAD-binding subunit